MIASAFLLRLDVKNAYRIWRRDSRKHASPNSAQTESVCAGALNIRLAGSAVYHGKLLDKPFIGDDTRPVSIEDINDANRLMYSASLLTLCLTLAFRAAFLLVICNGQV
jgi:adenosylcobinamide-phosphate synthase